MRSGSPVLADWAWTNSSGDLRAIPHRKRGVHVELARTTDARDQIVDRNLPQGLARLVGFPCVALNQPAIGSTDTGNRLTGREVDDFVHFHARVRFAPTQNW